MAFTEWIAEMLKSFSTCQSFLLILKILSVRTIKYEAEISIFCQSEWNFVSQNLRSDTFRHHWDWYPFQWLFRSWSWTSGGSLWFWWRGVGNFARILVAGPHSKGRSFTCTYVEGKPNINPHCECLGTSFPTSIVGFVSTCPVPPWGLGRVLLSRKKLLAYIHTNMAACRCQRYGNTTISIDKVIYPCPVWRLKSKDI